jgi:hypothetical protein
MFITQVSQPHLVDNCVAQVYFLQQGVFLVHKVPAEFAAAVRTEPLWLACIPEETRWNSVRVFYFKSIIAILLFPPLDDAVKQYCYHYH